MFFVMSVIIRVIISVGTGGKGAVAPNQPWTRSWDLRTSDDKCEHIVGETSTVKTESLMWLFLENPIKNMMIYEE